MRMSASSNFSGWVGFGKLLGVAWGSKNLAFPVTVVQNQTLGELDADIVLR